MLRGTIYVIKSYLDIDVILYYNVSFPYKCSGHVRHFMTEDLHYNVTDQFAVTTL